MFVGLLVDLAVPERFDGKNFDIWEFEEEDVVWKSALMLIT